MARTLSSFAILLLFSSASYAQSSPEYGEWVNKATTFYEAKQYKQCADAYTKAFAAFGGKGYSNDRYDAACCWSQAGNNDSAFLQLEKIATKGNFTNYNHMIEDADLANLHNDKRWQPLCDLVKQNKEKAEVNFNKPLVAILDTVMQTDQQYRMQIEEVTKKYGRDSKEVRELWDRQNYHDSVNLVKVIAIIDKYGWPGPDAVGFRGNNAVFLVIQHADISVQDKYLPVMREAVKNKKAYASHLALLEDRVNLRHGRKQIYGSQVSGDTDGLFNGELEDPDNVDKRRAEVGLNPLAEYLKHFNLRWDLEEYKRKHPAHEKK